MTQVEEPNLVELKEGDAYDVGLSEVKWSHNGVLQADVRECIALVAYNSETGTGGMSHLVADALEPEEITSKIWDIWGDASYFSSPEDFQWYAAGGFNGDPDYTEIGSRAVDESDRAYLRRIHSDNFFESVGASYESEWLNEKGVMTVSLDLDSVEFSVEKRDDYGELEELVFYEDFSQI